MQLLKQWKIIFNNNCARKCPQLAPLLKDGRYLLIAVVLREGLVIRLPHLLATEILKAYVIRGLEKYKIQINSKVLKILMAEDPLPRQYLLQII